MLTEESILSNIHVNGDLLREIFFPVSIRRNFH